MVHTQKEPRAQHMQLVRIKGLPGFHVMLFALKITLSAVALSPASFESVLPVQSQSVILFSISPHFILDVFCVSSIQLTGF